MQDRVTYQVAMGVVDFFKVIEILDRSLSFMEFVLVVIIVCLMPIIIMIPLIILKLTSFLVRQMILKNDKNDRSNLYNNLCDAHEKMSKYQSPLLDYMKLLNTSSDDAAYQAKKFTSHHKYIPANSP